MWLHFDKIVNNNIILILYFIYIIYNNSIKMKQPSYNKDYFSTTADKNILFGIISILSLLLNYKYKINKNKTGGNPNTQLSQK